MIKRIYHRIMPEKARLRIRFELNKCTSIFYRGSNLECNCCGKTFRSFKSKGRSAKRQNAECPYCGSLERTRLLLFYLQRETDIFTGNPGLLHFAPEQPLRSILKKLPDLYYDDADINPAYASLVFDIQLIPYETGCIDYIICSHVLGHVEDEFQAISELARVLSPTGVCLIMTLIDRNRQETFETEEADSPSKRLQYYTEPDLLRLHGRDFAERLRKHFEVEEIDYRTVFTNEERHRYSLGNGDREIIFRCTKKL